MVVHEIFKRRIHNTPITPKYGTALTVLDAEAMGVFRDRVVEAIGSNSRSLEMNVADSSEASAAEIAAECLAATDEEFAQVSGKFADKLTAEQTALNLPGGIMVIFSGSTGHPSRPLIGIVKADIHGGFRNNTSKVEYIKNLFLTPSTKLYKIALFRRIAGEA